MTWEQRMYNDNVWTVNVCRCCLVVVVPVPKYILLRALYMSVVWYKKLYLMRALNFTGTAKEQRPCLRSLSWRKSHMLWSLISEVCFTSFSYHQFTVYIIFVSLIYCFRVLAPYFSHVFFFLEEVSQFHWNNWGRVMQYIFRSVFSHYVFANAQLDWIICFSIA